MHTEIHRELHTQTCEGRSDMTDASVRVHDKCIPFRRDFEASWVEHTLRAAFLVLRREQ
jgi:hypothetical protein